MKPLSPSSGVSQITNYATQLLTALKARSYYIGNLTETLNKPVDVVGALSAPCAVWELSLKPCYTFFETPRLEQHFVTPRDGSAE